MGVLIGKKIVRDNLLFIEIVAKSEIAISATFSIFVDREMCYKQIIDIQEGTNIINVELKITKVNQCKNGVIVVAENHTSETYVIDYLRIPAFHEIKVNEFEKDKESLLSKLEKIDKERTQIYVRKFNQYIDSFY